MAKAAARLTRLRKQRKFLKSRARDMLRQGLKSLDELDKAEERERLEAEAQAQLAVAIQNPTSDLFDDLSLDPSDPF
jgi:hypothetical protein